MSFSLSFEAKLGPERGSIITEFFNGYSLEVLPIYENSSLSFHFGSSISLSI